MNYERIYNDIINNAKSQNRIKLKRDNPNYVYYENHHIIPKCLNGSDDKNNLILLTAREHFVCHKLLTYIYIKNIKIANAFQLMIFMNKRKYGITSRDYAYAIELFRSIPRSIKTRQKIANSLSIKLSGKSYIDLYGKERAKEVIKKISISNLGKQRSNEAKIKYRNCKLGIKHKTKICIYCNKEISIGNHDRWHGNKCKYKNNPLLFEKYLLHKEYLKSINSDGKIYCDNCGRYIKHNMFKKYHGNNCKFNNVKLNEENKRI